MAKKRSVPALENKLEGRKDHLPLIFAPSASIALIQFINTNMDKVNDEFGGINFKLSKDEYLFKLKDMECMTETRDEFLAVEVRPDKYIEQEHNILFVFNKRDVKQIIVDFDQKITYKSERNKEQIKQTNSYMG